jgi:sortase A
MQSKILSRRTPLIVAIAGLALSPILLFYFISKGSASIPSGEAAHTIIPIVPPKQGQINSGLPTSTVGNPVRLEIPNINVDATVEYVGLTSAGAVAVPKGPANAAWFDLGPRPGNIGSAVIVGHFGWKNNIPAVFDNLHKLQKGDKLYVKDEAGATITFVVRELRLYGENQDASDVFGSLDRNAHLNLITCEGAWNKARKSYSDRLVVFADKEQTGPCLTPTACAKH